jgi:hypothetical protein
MDLTIGPSLMITTFRPARSQCATKVPSTYGNKDIEVGFKAIGLGIAPNAAPREFRMVVNGEDFNLRYEARSAVTVFPVSVDIGVRAPQTTHTLRFAMDEGNTILISPSRQRADFTSDQDVEVTNNIRTNQLTLTKFATGTLESSELGKARNMAVAVYEGNRQLIARAVQIYTHKQVDVAPSGRSEVVGRQVPEPIGGCAPVARIGGTTEIRYQDSRSYTRQATFGYREDTGASQSLGFSAGNLNVFKLQGNAGWNQTFSADVNESFSSTETNERSTAVNVIPSFAYQMYRQELKYVRRAPAYYRDEC